MIGDVRTDRIYAVMMTSIDGNPIGGGASRRGEYASLDAANDHLARIKSQDCDGYVMTEMLRPGEIRRLQPPQE